MIGSESNLIMCIDMKMWKNGKWQETL